MYLADWEAAASAFAETWEDSRVLSSILDTAPEGDDFLSWKPGLEKG
jgi:hypothetical protein